MAIDHTEVVRYAQLHGVADAARTFGHSQAQIRGWIIAAGQAREYALIRDVDERARSMAELKERRLLLMDRHLGLVEKAAQISEIVLERVEATTAARDVALLVKAADMLLGRVHATIAALAPIDSAGEAAGWTPPPVAGELEVGEGWRDEDPGLPEILLTPNETNAT